MFRSIIVNIISMFLVINSSTAQSILELNFGPDLSLRGLSVVDDSIVWVSGSKGTVGKSLDGGKTWKWMNVKGYQKCDFRDIEAFSKDIAIIMAVAEPAYILKTINGGKTWKKVYENKGKGMFLDAMDFIDENNGYVIGDPVGGRFFIAKTNDGGESWHDESQKLYFPIPDSTEACFASSGTNIRMLNEKQFIYITGGVYSSLVNGKTKYTLPIIQGTTSTGANSIAIKDSLNFIVVGGDFTDVSAGPNCVITNDGGKTWSLPEIFPKGYKSCVEYLYGDTWICCGLTGVDISNDNGKTWKQISKESYHTCRKSKIRNAVYFSGNGSRIGRME